MPESLPKRVDPAVELKIAVRELRAAFEAVKGELARDFECSPYAVRDQNGGFPLAAVLTAYTGALTRLVDLGCSAGFPALFAGDDHVHSCSRRLSGHLGEHLCRCGVTFVELPAVPGA